MQNLIDIVHEDGELLVINKPADLVCHPTKRGPFSSLIGRVRHYLGAGAQPHLINRLDRETSGLVVVAKQSSPALQLRRLWESGAVEKRYLAIVHRRVPACSGMIDAPLGRDDFSLVAIKRRVRADGAPARTAFALLKTFRRDGRDYSLLSVRPLSGRQHQIRIHLAHYGHPIVGDKLYGGDEQCYLDFVREQLSQPQRAALLLPNHALHARSISFLWHAQERFFEAAPEPCFSNFASEPELGNSRQACELPFSAP